MTSASELFCPRRSRVGRTTATDLEFEHSTSDRNFHFSYTRRHHHHNNNHSRNDLNGCDPIRRSPHVRHPSQRFSSHNDRALVWLDQGTSQFVSSNSNSTEHLSRTSRQTLTGNDRLPGTVLLARARLLERLRGVSLSGSRQSRRVSFGTDNSDYALGDDLRVVDAGYWGTDNAPRFSIRRTSSNSTYQTQRTRIVQESSYKKKPPGLTSEDLEHLPMEVFSSMEQGIEEEISRMSWDCSICLESFKEGDNLIRLPCKHRFHAACLNPWVRTCGDCPYCRKEIVVSRH